jgi:hypothetical protein
MIFSKGELCDKLIIKERDHYQFMNTDLQIESTSYIFPFLTALISPYLLVCELFSLSRQEMLYIAIKERDCLEGGKTVFYYLVITLKSNIQNIFEASRRKTSCPTGSV